MKDHRRLDAFQLADDLAFRIYRETKQWPAEERFGLTSQVRRAAISVASNIVEGCARTTRREQLRFFEIAFGSAREVSYQLTLARRLEMGVSPELEELAQRCSGALYKLHTSSDDAS